MSIEICGHKLCKPCLVDYLADKIQHRQVADHLLICPFHGCSQKIPPGYIREYLPPDLEQKYYTYTLEDAKSGDVGFVLKTCPKENCQAPVEIPQDMMTVKCPLCFFEYCPQCNQDAHLNQTCQDYRLAQANLSEAQEADML